MAVMLAAAGCAPDNEIQAQRRELSTELATFDAGTVAVGDRQTVPIYLRSTGLGPVTIYDITSDDPEHFPVLSGWQTEDSDDDGTLNAMVIDRGSGEKPSYGLVEVGFWPEEDAYYRATLTITSNDSEVAERTEDGKGIWRVVLRGLGKHPCATVYPLFHDFGVRAPGGYYASPVTIENCGLVTLTVSDFDTFGSNAFYVATSTPIYVLPRTSEQAQLAWLPSSANPDAVDVSLGLNDPTWTDMIHALGNDCASSVDESWDADGDGWFPCGGDCDDAEAAVSPSAQEDSTNDIDDDCDGVTDESSDASDDADGDGYSPAEGDCHDGSVAVSPEGAETVNQIDDDCDGRVDDGTERYDDDADGYAERHGDCDDANALVFPGAAESANGLDDDCDGRLDEGSYTYDDDADGFPEFVGEEAQDCNDEDPWSYPGASEDCDGRDNDCDDVIDEDEAGTPEGACAFLVEREPTAAPPGGCASVGAPARSVSGWAIALLAVVASRRGRRSLTLR